MNWFSQSPDGYLWRANDGQPSGSAAVADPPAAGTSTSPAGGTPSGGGTPAPSSGAAPAATTGTPTGAAPAGHSTPDRSNWIPPHRLVEETTKRTAIETKLTAAQAQIDDLNRKIQVALGMHPQTPDQQEAEQVRRAFFQMFPQYEKLTPELIDELIELRGNRDDMMSASSAHWDNHANRTLRTLETKFLDVIGGEKLSDRQREKLFAGFMTMARRDPATFQRRYEAEDDTLLDEFVKEWTEDYVEPLRRTDASDVIRRRQPVPRGGPSAPVVTGAPQIDFSDKQAVENEAVRRLKDAGKLRAR